MSGDCEPWLTKRELAGQLRVSVRTIERLGLPAMRVGGQNRYKLSEVERFLAHKSRPARVIRFPSMNREPAA
jgi:excisionase family DNA binding protein